MSKIKESPEKVKEKAERMKIQKDRLLKEHLELKHRERSVSDGRGLERGRGARPRRKKSMVSLASEDDLLGRRMLSLAGPLTGLGDDGSKG